MSVQQGVNSNSSRGKYGFYVPEATSDEELSLLLLYKGFADKTTSHGVAHVYNAPSTWKKIVWGILAIVSLGALAYHLSQLIITYIKFDTTTDVRYNSSIRQLDFPAVTICNNNMIRNSTIADSLRDLVTEAANSSDQIAARYALGKALAYEYSLLDESDYKSQLGHQFEDMALYAEFAHEDVSTEFIPIFDPDYGNCYTFNDLIFNESYTAVRPGPVNGLWLLLNVEQYEYPPFLTDTSGIKVLVHDREEAPFPGSAGILVAPNTNTILTIKKTEFTRLDGRYGDCWRKDETAPITIYEDIHGYPYSKLACQQTCLQNEVIKNCSCFMPTIPYNSTFFDQTDLTQPCQTGTETDCMDEVYYNYTIGILKCTECKDPCLQSQFDVTPSSSVWPAPSYMSTLQEEIQEDWPDLYNRLKTYYTNESSLDVPIQQNFLQLEIYYEKLSVTQITEAPQVTDFQFISDLGGSLGLWVGWSMLTIFEFFEFGADLLALCCCITRRAKGQKINPPYSGREEHTSPV